MEEIKFSDYELLEEKLNVQQLELRILDLQCRLDDGKEWDDDFIQLTWRFDELVRCFDSDDVHLMRSAVKLASRHVADVEKRFYDLPF